MIEFFIFSAIVNAIVFSVMGFFIFLNDRKNKSNIVYSLFCLSVVLWSISYAIWLSSRTEAAALFWSRMLNFFAIFIPVFFCHWVFVLTGIDRDRIQKWFLFLSYAATVFFAFFGFHPYYVDRVEEKFFFPYWPMPGQLHPYYLIVCWGIILVYTWLRLFKIWRESAGSKREQFRYVLIAMPVGFGGGFTNFLLWYGIPFPPWFNILVSVWGLSFLYIIFRYSFMEVRSILSQTAIYAFAFLPILFLSFVVFSLSGIVGSNMIFFVVETSFAASSIVLFGWFLKFFEKMSGKYFYNSFYGLQDKILVLSKKINQMIEMEKLSDFVVSSLRDALKTENIAVALKDSEKGVFLIQKSAGFPDGLLGPVLDRKFLFFWLEKAGKSLSRKSFLEGNDFDKDDREKFGKDIDGLEKEIESGGIEIIIPLLVEKKLVGTIFLGKKGENKIYTSQEVGLLEFFAAQASVAFNNSLAYRELDKRKEELEKFYKLTIGRELRMAELKEQIKTLEAK